MLETTPLEDDMNETLIQADTTQNPNELIKELIGKIEVHSFVEVVPSINDIFIQIVEGGRIMKQIFLVLKREYLTRVKKKSFLLATILTPLIFPLLIGAVIYFGSRDTGGTESIYVLDQSGLFKDKFTDDSYSYTYLDGELENAKQQFQDEGAYGLLYIPEINFDDDSKTYYDNLEFYSKSNTGINIERSFESQIRRVLEQIKLDRSGLDPELINSLKANVDLNTFNLSDSGEAKESNSDINLAVGYIFGFLIYMFIFIYGGQIMQSVLDEKTSRIVE